MDFYMISIALYKYSHPSLCVQIIEQIDVAQLAKCSSFEPDVFISKAEFG